MNWLLILIIVVLVYLTVKNNWFYDPTSPDRPKKTRAENWFLSSKKRRN
ncbi:hypothetical protein [Anaerobacillus arseniciselenatis]|nr:hypothetical protein [Anaerobacillus arseniciselenatis]